MTEYKGDYGTCGFCGLGNGWLGEQGDESTRHISSVVRSGTPGNWKYKRHENAYGDGQLITWCGRCVGGLKHYFQRYDDTNLRAKMVAYKLWNQMDAPRFALWETGPEISKQYQDDPAIHLEKLRVKDDLILMEKENMRRHGFDLVKDGWRP